jgi:hypothetical protein
MKENKSRPLYPVIKKGDYILVRQKNGEWYSREFVKWMKLNPICLEGKKQKKWDEYSVVVPPLANHLNNPFIGRNPDDVWKVLRTAPKKLISKEAKDKMLKLLKNKIKNKTNMIYLEITDPTKLSLSMPMIVWFVWYLGTGLYLSGPMSPYKN